MNCHQWREEFRTWLEKSIHQEEENLQIPRALADHAELCPACASRLRAAELLIRGDDLKVYPPPDLTGKIYRKIGLREKGKQVFRYFKHAIAALLLIAITSFLTLRFTDASRDEYMVVHLKLEAPEATTVTVVGDWNGWDPSANEMEDPDGDGIWETEIKLKPGNEYRYQFLVDDQQWIPDPNAPLKVRDGFGGVNSVLQL